MAELTHDDVKKILEIIDGMQDYEVRLEIGELRLHVSRRPGAAIADQPAPATPARNATPVGAVSSKPPAVFAVPAGQIAVRAPAMGTFYRAASPGAKPYVEVGDRVRPDDTVGVF